MSLEEYWKRGTSRRLVSREGNIYVVQKHNARRLHYDLGLEREAVLKSWTVPKGPPAKKGVKRLAIQTKDHPIAYVNFSARAPEGMQGILKASTLIFFAYLGFEDIVTLAEESKSPERDIPKALILSVVITATFYVFVAVAVVSLADWQELGASCCPLAFAASKSLGQTSFLTMSAIALFATSNTVLILLIVTSRMIYGMARDGSLPRDLSKLSS